MPRVITAKRSPEYLAQCVREAEAHVAQLRSIADRFKQNSLLERISQEQSSPTSLIPLIDRIQLSTPYTPPPPLDERLHFRKTKIMLREKEFWQLITETSNKLGLIQKRMKSRGVQDAHALGMQTLFDNFEELKNTYHDRVDRFTNKQWRLIKRDCHAIRNIPIQNLVWSKLCAEAAALGNQGHFLYD